MLGELKLLIDRYLEGGKNRSIQQLADRAGVSYSTVRRIAQGEVKAVELASVLGILKVICSPRDSQVFLKTHYPDFGAYIESISTKAAITSQIAEDLERALLDEERFVIVSLAATPEGTSRGQVLATLGTASLHKLDEMLDLGTLCERHDRIFTCQEQFGSTDNLNIKTQIRHTLPFIRDEHIGRQLQHCALHTKGVSREAQLKAHALIQETMEKLTELAKQSPGPLPIFYGVVMGTFTSEDVK